MLSPWRKTILDFLQIFIKLNFPRINSLTTKELNLWLNDPEKSNPLLLDARSVEEYTLSHLQAAKSVTSVQNTCRDATCRVSRNDSCHVSTLDTPIVVYCSVGYRSANVANSLLKAGYSHVFNLSGGIFQWVNEERPVFQNTQSQNTQSQNTQSQNTQLRNFRLVKSVHPYNKLWGKLLKPEYRDSL